MIRLARCREPFWLRALICGWDEYAMWVHLAGADNSNPTRARWAAKAATSQGSEDA